MIKEAIEKIEAMAAVEEFLMDGRRYMSKQIIPVKEPEIPSLGLDTLRGFVDYLKSGFDGAEIGYFPSANPEPVGRTFLQVAIMVDSPTVVSAFLPVAGPWKTRIKACTAGWPQRQFPFGQFLSQEDFVIKALAMFQETDDFGKVMELAGKIVCADEAELTDNGVSQAVTVKRGFKQESGRILPLRPVLRPVRTFTEVEQPASEFIFRMKSEPVALALFEADMGKWEMEAKLNIKAFLEAELPGVPVFV